MDLLKDFRCHFLFDENRVLVDPPEKSAFGTAAQALVLGKRFHPYVEVQFGPNKATAVWDSGGGITVVDLNFIHRYPALFQEAAASHGTDSTGAIMETPMFMMAASVIGNQPFPLHKVAGVDLSHVNSTTETPMDMILGYVTVRKANWWFDFPHKRWAITKLLTDSSPPHSTRLAGFGSQQSREGVKKQRNMMAL
jgi:hypothetical protein